MDPRGLRPGRQGSLWWVGGRCPDGGRSPAQPGEASGAPVSAASGSEPGPGQGATSYAARAAAIACRVPYSVTQATPTTAASASATVPDQPAEW